jgi:hypothetical protein
MAIGQPIHFSNNSVYIPNYAGSNFKSYSIDTVQERNDGYCFMNLAAGLWSDTSAITTIKLTPNTNSFLQYSTAYLIRNIQRITKGKTMPTKLIVDCSTGITTEVELTAEEIAEREAMAAEYAVQKAQEDAEAAAKAAAKESANAKLAALGLTAEEIEALTK